MTHTEIIFDIYQIADQAKLELAQEEFKNLVIKKKLEIKNKKNSPWYCKIFPWKITITRR